MKFIQYLSVLCVLICVFTTSVYADDWFWGDPDDLTPDSSQTTEAPSEQTTEESSEVTTEVVTDGTTEETSTEQGTTEPESSTVETTDPRNR